MKDNNEKICFILVAGFSPDEIPVLKLKRALEKSGHTAIASGFFGVAEVSAFHGLTAMQCAKNISELINEVKRRHDKVYGIGISLGGAFLMEHAKNNNNLDGIVSIGTPFRLKKQGLIKIAQILYPFFYPAWRHLQKIKKLRLPPIGAGNMVVDYIKHDFIKGLDSISTPLLFLHSKKDIVTEYGAVAEYASKIPSLKQKITFFTNGNHVIDNNPKLIIEHTFNFFGLTESAAKHDPSKENKDAAAQSDELVFAKSESYIGE